MIFNIVDRWEDFLELRESWNGLLCRVDEQQIFYDYNWAYCFVENIQPSYKQHLCIVIGVDKGNVICIMPFVHHEGIIRFLTTSTVDYNQIYIDHKYNKYSVISKGIRYLLETKRDIKEFALTSYRGSDELHCLEDVLRKSNFSAFIEEETACPYIPVSVEKNKFQKSQMKDIQRKEKRLKEKYNVSFETKNVFDEEIFEFIMKCKEKKYGKNLLSQDEMLKFYANLYEKLSQNVYINVLRLDDKIACAHMGFKDENKLYYYMPAYDDYYAVDGVGAIMLKHLIDENDANREFDFLRGNEAYKFYYCDSINMNFHLYAYVKNKNMILFLIINKLKNSKMIRRLLGR